MRWKISVFLTILMLWSICFTNSAFTQPKEGKDKNDLYCLDLPDTQEVARCFQDRQLLRQLLDAKDAVIANQEREISLLKQEIELQNRVLSINEREIEATRRALNDMKEVTDRALKLAETGKPRSNWQLQGLIGLAAILVGVLIAK